MIIGGSPGPMWARWIFSDLMEVSKMKKMMLAVIISVIFFGFRGGSYPATLVITSINDDYFTAVPVGLYQSGYGDISYDIPVGPEDLLPGDLISVTMSDNGSPDILDDSVIDYKYAGYLW